MALRIICLVSMLVGAQSSVDLRGRHIAFKHNGTISQQQDASIAPDKYIAGGHPAAIGQFPSIARLSIKTTRGTYLCAGSLIGERHVLTAAHCLDHDIKYHQDISIYLGEYDRKSYPVDCVKQKCVKNRLVYPDKVVKHPDYDSTTVANDIALMRLQKRAPLTAYIKPIPLPPFDVDHPINKGAALAIVGWGETESAYSSDILQATELNLIPRANCLKYGSDVPPKHLCAGDVKGKDTCPGDSGGPLYMYYQDKYYLSGIVSYGPALMKCGTAEVGYYTNVYKYIKWIKENMK
ncbi:melanization protease 1-like [Leguminivora glycinivorella]|uniref:melanization protease 1-like n=1 Tax=Leguminivora glycinivorella TaxID=1035111 RepID=UPI00200E94C8|nr:melanization protease 1-like [Leguminivora glycinivorella]